MTAYVPRNDWATLDEAQLAIFFNWAIDHCIPARWEEELRTWVYEVIGVQLPANVDYMRVFGEISQAPVIDDEYCAGQLRKHMGVETPIAAPVALRPVAARPQRVAARYEPAPRRQLPWLYIWIAIILAVLGLSDGLIYRAIDWSPHHAANMFVKNIRGDGLGKEKELVGFDTEGTYFWMVKDYCQPAYYALDDKGVLLPPPVGWPEGQRDLLLETNRAGCIAYHNTGAWNSAGQWKDTTWQAVQVDIKTGEFVVKNYQKDDGTATLVWVDSSWWNIGGDWPDISEMAGSSMYAEYQDKAEPTRAPLPTAALVPTSGDNPGAGAPFVPEPTPESPAIPVKTTPTLTGGTLPSATPLPVDWQGPTPTLTGREALAHLVDQRLATAYADATATSDAMGSPKTDNSVAPTETPWLWPQEEAATQEAEDFYDPTTLPEMAPEDQQRLIDYCENTHMQGDQSTLTDIWCEGLDD